MRPRMRRTRINGPATDSATHQPNEAGHVPAFLCLVEMSRPSHGVPGRPWSSPWLSPWSPLVVALVVALVAPGRRPGCRPGRPWSSPWLSPWSSLVVALVVALVAPGRRPGCRPGCRDSVNSGCDSVNSGCDSVNPDTIPATGRESRESVPIWPK
jgi:hypothetical protein